jgi:hypothetical protein
VEVEISPNMKFFKLYPVGREATNWGRIGAFRSLRSQLTVKIFLACELMAGVHNASMTWSRESGGRARRIKVGTNLRLSRVVSCVNLSNALAAKGMMFGNEK